MKASSKAVQWWKRYGELELKGRPGKVAAEEYELMKELEVEDLPALIQIMDDEARPHQRDLLIELANLQDGKAAEDRFIKEFPAVKKLRSNYLPLSLLRDWLRSLWREPKITAAVVHAVAWGVHVLPLDKSELKDAAAMLESLFLDTPKSEKSGWLQIPPLGVMRPQDFNFAGQLAWAIAQNYSRFRICKNPDCATPFYLWRRFDQQYCSSDGCVRYANRIAANKYWSDKGKQRRSVRQKDAVIQ